MLIKPSDDGRIACLGVPLEQEIHIHLEERLYVFVQIELLVKLSTE